MAGGSRGIGRGIAIRLAENGATVVVNYVKDEEAAKDTVRRVEEAGGEGLIIRADVSRPEEVANMVERTHIECGTLDFFVNNALGNLLGFLTPPATVTLDQFDEAYNCQARAFLVGVQAASSVLSDGGRVVALSYWPGSHLGGFFRTSHGCQQGRDGSNVSLLCSCVGPTASLPRERHSPTWEQ